MWSHTWSRVYSGRPYLTFWWFFAVMSVAGWESSRCISANRTLTHTPDGIRIRDTTDVRSSQALYIALHVIDDLPT